MMHSSVSVPLFFLLSVAMTSPAHPQDSLAQRVAELERLVNALGETGLAPEISIYEANRRGVVRVNSGLQYGTGFIIDARLGLILTNDHVVEPGQPLSVSLDSVTRVPAVTVEASPAADMLILRIHPDWCRGRPALQLPQLENVDGLVRPGERVVAIGYPLHQRSAVTSGIVSAVRGRALISDVNLNPGNSGGPLLNMSGVVVGMNTFVDQGDLGPGISGSLSLDGLGELLEEAAQSGEEGPSKERLPVSTGPAYPLDILRTTAEAFPEPGVYRDLMGIDAGPFRVSLETPLYHFVLLNEIEREIASDRRKREEKAGLPEHVRYGGLVPNRDWFEYVGDLTRPVVVLRATPEQGETTGSALLRGVIAALTGSYATIAKYRFKSDIQKLQLWRNGQPVEAIRGGTRPLRVYEQGRLVEMKDVAYEGVYVYPPETFAPGPGNVPPGIVLQVFDLKRPADSTSNTFALPEAAVARVWNDFAPYFLHYRPDSQFVSAVANVFPDDGTVMDFDIDTRESKNSVLGLLWDLGYIVQATDDEWGLRTMFVTREEDVSRARVIVRSVPGKRGYESRVSVLSDRQDWHDEIVQAIRDMFTEP